MGPALRATFFTRSFKTASLLYPHKQADKHTKKNLATLLTGKGGIVNICRFAYQGLYNSSDAAAVLAVQRRRAVGQASLG